MTKQEARKLYEAAGADWDDSSDTWGEDVRKEMEAVVNAASDQEAGKVIAWWHTPDEWKAYWDSPTKFAGRIRRAAKKMGLLT